MIPQPYTVLPCDRRARRLLSDFVVSSLADGMSTVTIARLAVRTAPAGEVGQFVRLAIAADTLPSATGALTLERYLRRPARTLGLVHACHVRSCSAQSSCSQPSER